MDPEKGAFDFDFGEKSTRQAAIVAIISATLFCFLYRSEFIFDLRYNGDDWPAALFISMLFGAVTFIMGLILLRSENYSVILFYPVWFVASQVIADGSFDAGEAIATFISSFIISMSLIFILGLALEWVRRGR